MGFVVTKPKRECDIDTLRSLISYDPNTGEFTWNARGVPKFDAKWAGKKAGCIHASGRVLICLMGRRFYAHRIAWAITYGCWPDHGIDHIDGNGLNNCLSNLREATQAENQQNRIRNANNKSGYMGVHWHPQNRKWRASIRLDGKNRHLGLFDCPKEAHHAYLATKAKIHTFNPVPREA